MIDINTIGVRCVLCEKSSPYIIVRVRDKIKDAGVWYKPNQIYKVIRDVEYDDIYSVIEKRMIGFGLYKIDCDII